MTGCGTVPLCPLDRCCTTVRQSPPMSRIAWHPDGRLLRGMTDDTLTRSVMTAYGGGYYRMAE